MTVLRGLVCLLATTPWALAEAPSALDQVRHELRASVPADWQVHVSRRDGAIVAFVTPPYQQAFDLWYDPEKLRAVMLRLCPAKAAPLWQRLTAGEKLVLVPTVGGKTADAMRIICDTASAAAPG